MTKIHAGASKYLFHPLIPNYLQCAVINFRHIDKDGF
jgi:hypothetical protein